MPELRVDGLTGEQVILAPARALRPDTFRVSAEPAPARDDSCPFCSGNEHETPPEVARIGPGRADGPGWRVRVVPNKYPIVGEGVGGAHEVVVLAAHNADIAAIGAEAATEVFTALRDRARFHIAAGCAYAQPFVNHGRGAGASIAHPHAQLVALDTVPPRVADVGARFASSERDLVVEDRRSGAAVCEHAGAAVWCPAASRSPFFMRAALLEAQPRFEETDDDGVRRITHTLQDALARMHAVLDQPDYNLVVRTAAHDSRAPFHWWVDIVPRLTTTAGFEMGTGLRVNIVAPLDAAAALRTA